MLRTAVTEETENNVHVMATTAVMGGVGYLPYLPMQR